MSNIEKAKDALKLIEKGENPLDNYELVKLAILESEDAVELLWSQLEPKIIDELKKDKDCKPIIKAYVKKLEDEIKQLGKESITYKFKNDEEYGKWKEKAKDTILTRRTIFDIEYVWPVMADMLDKLFFEFSEKAEICNVSRVTAPCPECNNQMVYRAKSDKMVCTGCGISKDKKEVENKTTESIKTRAYDMFELPSSDSIARQIVGNLSNMIEFHVKNETKKRNKE